MNLWLIAISILGDPSYSPYDKDFVLGVFLDFPPKFLVLGSFNVCFLFPSLFFLWFPFFFILSSRNMLLPSATRWIICCTSRLNLGLPAHGLWYWLLFSLDLQEEFLMPQSMVWLLWTSLCQKWDVLPSDTKKMVTAFSKGNSVIWPDYSKVKVIIFNLKNLLKFRKGYKKAHDFDWV